MNMPRDRRLIQESLAKVAEGPHAFRAWAKEHRDEIDSKFMAMLDKMANYSRDHSTPEIAQTFAFLKACFDKITDVAGPLPIAVTADNFRRVWQEAEGYLRRGKPHRALQLFECLALYLAQHPDGQLLPLLNANLGIACAQIGRKDRALEYLQGVVVENLPERQQEKILANLGTVYKDTGDLLKAKECYARALTIAGERRDPAMQIIYLNHLALIALEGQNLEEAAGYQEQSVNLAEQSGDKRSLQDSLTRLALLVNLQGDHRKCEELCKRALDLSSQIS